MREGIPVKLAMDPAYVDAKGRIFPEKMTDREVLEEILIRLRNAEDSVEALIEHVKSHPMLAAFLK